MTRESTAEPENWKLEDERARFFAGQLSGPLRRDRSTLSDDELRPWLQDHLGLSGYPRAQGNGYLTVARLLSLHRDDSDNEGPDISVTYAWLGPGGQVLRGSATEGYDRYSPGGLGVLFQDESAFIVAYDDTTARSTLHPASSPLATPGLPPPLVSGWPPLNPEVPSPPLATLAPPGLPSVLVSGWPQVKPEALSRVLQLKSLQVSLVVLQPGGLETSGAPPGAIDFPLPSAFPSREGMIFPSVVPEVEAFHDLPFEAVKRAYAVINSSDFERRLAEFNPPGLVVIASRDEALSRRFAHLLRGLRRARRQPFVHIGHLLGSVLQVKR